MVYISSRWERSVQTGEMVLIGEAGIERMHAMPRGFAVLS